MCFFTLGVLPAYKFKFGKDIRMSVPLACFSMVYQSVKDSYFSVFKGLCGITGAHANLVNKNSI